MTLKESFKNRFLIGSAFGHNLFNEESHPTLGLISQHFNSVTPCNELKWRPFNPGPAVFNYKPADDFVEFGTSNSMYVVGHVLFWHNQTPQWIFTDDNGAPVSRAQLLKRMRERVRSVASRYKGKFHAWDVVNESILDNGTLRESDWTRIIGADFIEQAFRIADEELPEDVELIYNDYSMAGEAKRDAVAAMVRNFKKKGIRISGVGMQGHWSLQGPLIGNIEKSIVAFAKAGVDVHITELDIDVLPRSSEIWNGNADVKLRLQNDPKLDPYKSSLPADVQKQLADRYADIFRLFLKHQDKIKRVTFWGPTDKHSWLNKWPIKGRTNHALLFDRNGRPKPAFQAVIKVSQGQTQEWR